MMMNKKENNTKKAASLTIHSEAAFLINSHQQVTL